MKKKIIALLCIVSVVASTVFMDFPSANKAAEVKAAETVAATQGAEELAPVTLMDLGFSNGTYDNSGKVYESGFDHTIVSFYDSVSQSGNLPRIHFGSREGKEHEREGIVLLWNPSGQLVVSGYLGYSGSAENQLNFTETTIDPTEFGHNSFFGQKILLQLKTQFVGDDIHFTILIDNKEALTIEIADSADKLGNYILFCDGLHTVQAYEDLANYEHWTFSEMGGTDGNITESTSTHSIGGSLDKTYFQAKMTFPSGNFGQFFLGSGSFYGILLADATSGEDESIKVQIVSSHNNSQQWGVTVGTIAEAVAGELRNKELNIGISVRFVDVNTSNQTGNLIIGIWLDGKLYNDTLFVSKGADRSGVKVTETRLSDFTKRVHGGPDTNVAIKSVASPKVRGVSDEFTKYTLSDINPQYNSGEIQGAIPGTTLDKVLYSARMTYTQASGQFHYAADSNNYGGFTLYPGSERKTLNYARVAGSIPSFSAITISATDAIGQEAFDTSFGLQITTEYVDADFDGNKDDVKLGLWFNRALYRNQYFYHIDAQLVVGMRVVTNENGAPGMEDFHDKLPAYTDDYVDWSFEQACFTEKTVSSAWKYSSKTIGEVLDKHIFHGKVTFDNSGSSVYIGQREGSEYRGLGFQKSGNELRFGVTTGADVLDIRETYAPSDFGLTTFVGETLELSIATRFIRSAGQTKDSQGNIINNIVIEAIPMVNGILPKGKIHTFTIDGRNFVRRVAVLANGTIHLENVACDTKLDDLPKGLTTVHMNDLGLADTVENWTQGSSVYYEKGSFDNTIIPFKINYGDVTDSIMRFGCKEATIYNSIGIYRTGEKIVVGGGYSSGECKEKLPSIEISPEEGQSFANRDINIHIVTQYMDMDYDGQKDDLKFGVYIDGKLVNGRYIYAYDLAPVLGSCIVLKNGNIASITTGGYTEKTLDKSMYTNYTLIDAGIKDGIGQISGKLRDANGEEVAGSAYDKVLFGAKVKFLTESARMHFAAQVNRPLSGMQLRLKGDGDLIVEDYHKWFPEREDLEYASVTVEAEKYLSSGTFTGQEFLLQWTTDIRNLDGETEANDVLFGLWINGKLVNERYIVIMDSAHLLESYINFNEGNSEFYSLWNIQAPSNEGTEYYKLTDDNPYLVIADTFTNKTGTTYINGNTVTVSGDYTATFEGVDEYLQATTQNVVLWKEWDFSADGVHDVRDLVALKKVEAKMTLPTKAAQMAISKVDSAARINDYRGFLVGKVEKLSTDGIGTLRYQNDDSGLVMPIGSWIGPTTVSGFHAMSGKYLSDYGLESNFLQKKYYDMIDDLGINQITYVSDDYNSASYRTVLKGLAMAEEYGLQVYVEDSGIANDITNTDEKTASQLLAERANAYGRYSSFAGLHVYDEPESNNFYFSKGSHLSMDAIKNKTSLLNSYTNLAGYVNLYPDKNTTNANKNYNTEYLPEFVAKCNPKILAYDDYPFEVGNSTSETIEGSHYYFSNLKQIRNQAIKSGIPFVGFIGTGENYKQTQQKTDNIFPTSEQLKWNVNTLLAYGAKGYNWFTLFEPWYFALEGDTDITGLDANRSGLISATGTKTRHYNTAVAINNWVSNIDHILMEATSEMVLATGEYAMRNTGINTNSYNGMTVSAANPEYGAIVGVFDYNGKTAYYVVNNYVKVGADGSNTGAASQTITLDFGSTSKTCTVYNGATLGNTVTGTACELDIEAGGAALVVVD